MGHRAEGNYHSRAAGQEWLIAAGVTPSSVAAVVLDLVNPVRAGRWFIGGGFDLLCQRPSLWPCWAWKGFGE